LEKINSKRLTTKLIVVTVLITMIGSFILAGGLLVKAKNIVESGINEVGASKAGEAVSIIEGELKIARTEVKTISENTFILL